jgi:toxin CcdB
MAQFDVHKNPGKHREAIPYVVIVQSSLFDSYRRRDSSGAQQPSR